MPAGAAIPRHSLNNDDEEQVQPRLKGGIGGIHRSPGCRCSTAPWICGLRRIYGGNQVWVKTVIYGGQGKSRVSQSDSERGYGRQGEGGGVGLGVAACHWGSVWI